MPDSKVILDSVHGDIKLYPHETAITDTKVFQRLHGIKQLGLSYLVFPTAIHTRFEHSIGCVAVAERIMAQLRSKPQSRRLATDSVTEKVRVAALLHDLAHIPFGHTLEDELSALTERHDSSEVRLRRFKTRLMRELEQPGDHFAKARELAEYAFKVNRTIKVIEDEIATGQKRATKSGILPDHEWYIADIIGNTICADLLDYVRRDMQGTGLNDDYDDRLYTYFEVAPDERGRKRLAIRIATNKGLRLDAVSDVLQVLRMRYSLSEKVLYHHTKNVASAMLGELLSYVEFKESAFDQLRDDQLIMWLANAVSRLPRNQKRAAKKLLDNFLARRLHKTIFKVGPAQQQPYQLKNSEHLGKVYSTVAARNSLQREIREQIPQLAVGDVIVYSPPPDMRLKEVWVNVLARNNVPVCRPLRAEAEPYLPRVILDEVELLERKYEALWAWTVSLSQDCLNYAFAVQLFLRDRLQVSNDPFLQSNVERQPELEIGRKVMVGAPGEYKLQAKAVELAEGRMAIELVAASGEPDALRAYYDRVVAEARDELQKES